MALMTQSLQQLEELLARSQADPEMLDQLEDELRYRSVPRALDLLIRVQQVRQRLGGRAGVSATSAPASHPAARESRRPARVRSRRRAGSR